MLTKRASTAGEKHRVPPEAVEARQASAGAVPVEEARSDEAVRGELPAAASASARRAYFFANIR